MRTKKKLPSVVKWIGAAFCITVACFQVGQSIALLHAHSSVLSGSCCVAPLCKPEELRHPLHSTSSNICNMTQYEADQASCPGFASEIEACNLDHRSLCKISRTHDYAIAVAAFGIVHGLFMLPLVWYFITGDLEPETVTLMAASAGVFVVCVAVVATLIVGPMLLLRVSSPLFETQSTATCGLDIKGICVKEYRATFTGPNCILHNETANVFVWDAGTREAMRSPTVCLITSSAFCVACALLFAWYSNRALNRIDARVHAGVEPNVVQLAS